VPEAYDSWDGKAEDFNLLMPGAVKEHEPTEKVVCDFPWEKITVPWDGEFVPCCFDYNKKYSLGNINEQSLVEIWNGDRMHALRREMKSNNVTNPLCQGCEYLYNETPDV
jgi:radical SAM protein with 4Fe4S-binding SPASM domain